MKMEEKPFQTEEAETMRVEEKREPVAQSKKRKKAHSQMNAGLRPAHAARKQKKKKKPKQERTAVRGRP